MPPSWVVIVVGFTSVLSLELNLQPPAESLSIVEQTAYYDVAGTSAEQLRATITRLGPTGANGKRFDAYTKWDIHWHFKARPEGTECAATSLMTTLQVVTTFPKWSTRDNNLSLAERWDRFVAALRVHESGHFDIARQGATSIHESLSRIRSTTCQRLEESINSTGLAMVDDIKREQEDYDRRTNAGISQGTRFP